MKQETVLLLNDGGLRSLVAGSLLKYNEPDTRHWLLFVDDGRSTVGQAFEFAQKQGAAWQAFRVDRVKAALSPRAVLAPDQSDQGDASADPSSLGPLRRPAVLLTALAFAHQRGIQRVQMPAACDQDLEASALVTQQIELCQELIGLEPTPTHRSADTKPPRLETPLLDFTDTQVLELGAQTGADYAKAWSCTMSMPKPCWQCQGCKRRLEAFKDAGLDDPIAPLQLARGQAAALHA